MKATVVGPYSRARRTAADAAVASRSRATLDHAETLNHLIRDLAAEGCLMVEVHEPAAVEIGDDAGRAGAVPRGEPASPRRHRRRARVTRGRRVVQRTSPGSRPSWPPRLRVSPWTSSPDPTTGVSWSPRRAIAGSSAARCRSPPGRTTGPETLLWAAGYAASTGGRGMDRVGLATSASLGHLPWPVAMRKLERLGEASRLVLGSVDERAAAVDPRAVSNRSAALGRVQRGGASRARGNRPPT